MLNILPFLLSVPAKSVSSEPAVHPCLGIRKFELVSCPLTPIDTAVAKLLGKRARKWFALFNEVLNRISFALYPSLLDTVAFCRSPQLQREAPTRPLVPLGSRLLATFHCPPVTLRVKEFKGSGSVACDPLTSLNGRVYC